MPFFALRNLSSSEITECTPWTFSAKPPEEVCGKEGKSARDKWINTPTTEWQVYSAFEAVNPGGRISEPKIGAEEGNPPFRLHAFVADIDCPVSDDELASGIARLKFRPNYFERTLSGNARLLWLLEAPVSFPNRRFAVEFLKLAAKRLHPEVVAPNFDTPAWDEPNRYYTNSGQWYAVDADARISKRLVDGWVVEVAEKHLWRKDRGAVDLPLPMVYAELLKKWPSMNWPSDFTEGSQGPSFWIEGSTSPKSAIVKPTGMFTFSAHQSKPFYSWADLLGKDFVERHAAELMGKAVEGIYHDGGKYYRQDGNGAWKYFSKDDITLHLTTDRGLSAQKMDGMPSEVNRALSYIHNWHGIEGAAPFVFQPSGILKRPNGTFLNTFTRKALRPADGPQVWGPDGKFPFLSKYLDGLFHPESVPARPLDYFLSWLSRFYRGAHEQNLESGQSVFILGPTGIGKTFLSQGLLPHLVGGGAGAESYLMGQTGFNSELFQSALWTVDDNSVTNDAQTHRKFSAMIKSLAANTTFQFHEKFRVPCTVEWTGRTFVTANQDEQSARIVPNLSISIMDKLMLFRGASLPPVDFPSRQECIAIIHNEAPFLARFLLDYEIPEACRGSSRFGVVSYHEKGLVSTADQSSDTANFREQIEHWRTTYFADKPDLDHWKGTAFQLSLEFNKDSAFSAAIRTNGHQVGRQLSALKAAGVPFLEVAPDNHSVRDWIIYREDHRTPPPTYKQNSTKFEKTA